MHIYQKVVVRVGRKVNNSRADFPRPEQKGIHPEQGGIQVNPFTGYLAGSGHKLPLPEGGYPDRAKGGVNKLTINGRQTIFV
jgi:hypothetical protein